MRFVGDWFISASHGPQSPSRQNSVSLCVPVPNTVFKPAEPMILLQRESRSLPALNKNPGLLRRPGFFLRGGRVRFLLDSKCVAAPSNQTGSELDIVEVYQGVGDNGFGSGTAAVHVNATDRPVTLALGAFRTVNWTVTLDPGAKLEKVILASIYPNTITGLPG